MPDPVARLLALRAKPSRLVLGLSSGTSADGIDAALVDIAGSGADTQVAPRAFLVTPYPAPLRARILQGVGSALELAELDVRVGDAFVAAGLAVLEAAGLPLAAVDLVGSHGQTMAHAPRSAGRIGASLQIGQPAVLAEKLGAPVVSSFRARDLAAGGEGAPLVPLADFLLFHRPGRARALQNIGGIANVTVVAGALEDLVAFDTGPGNMPLDEAARAVSGGTQAHDSGGARAARGAIDAAVVRELHRHPFFNLPVPRSTGREAFGAGFVAPLLRRFAGRPDDLLATLTRFVAETIRRAYADHVPVALDEVLVSGGGVHNATLMRHLAELFAPVPVATIASEGVDPDAKEAIAFALLANETLFGRPGNVPGATGASGPRVLGTLTP